jgi:hydrogenase/urease accessory protein HupE
MSFMRYRYGHKVSGQGLFVIIVGVIIFAVSRIAAGRIEDKKLKSSVRTVGIILAAVCVVLSDMMDMIYSD